ncbi:MAG: HAD family phosphatase [Pseudomonadota bacterium]
MDATKPAILWDVDGTLVDSEPLHEAALKQALCDTGLAPPRDLHQHIIGRDALEVHGWCRQQLGLTLDLDDWLDLCHRAYLSSVKSLKPRAGAVALFRALRDDGYRQAIVSNSDRMLVNANLDAVGLNMPGLITVSWNDVRAGKPAPEPYLRAAWLLGVEPEHCLVIEDSLTGAQSGLAAGMRTIFWPESDTTTMGGAAAANGAATPEGAKRIVDLDHLAAAIRESRIQ